MKSKVGVPSQKRSGPIIEDWLVTLNAERTISAPFYARNYLDRNADYEGKIKDPVLTLDVSDECPECGAGMKLLKSRFSAGYYLACTADGEHRKLRPLG